MEVLRRSLPGAKARESDDDRGGAAKEKKPSRARGKVTKATKAKSVKRSSRSVRSKAGVKTRASSLPGGSPTNASACFTTVGSRRIRRCPSPSVSSIRAFFTAAATAAPSVHGTSRSSRSWITSSGIERLGPTARALSSARPIPARRSIVRRAAAVASGDRSSARAKPSNQ